jgi:hypothetical protein
MRSYWSWEVAGPRQVNDLRKNDESDEGELQEAETRTPSFIRLAQADPLRKAGRTRDKRTVSFSKRVEVEEGRGRRLVLKRETELARTI